MQWTNSIDNAAGLVVLRKNGEGKLELRIWDSVSFWLQRFNYAPHDFNHDFFSPNRRAQRRSRAFVLKILPKVKRRFGKTAFLAKLLGEHGDPVFYDLRRERMVRNIAPIPTTEHHKHKKKAA